MPQPGAPDYPLRVAVIGSGPAGFYTADHLLKQQDLTVTVDMYDRLPTPYGLVRFGVAPDHEKIKNVTKVFDKVAAKDTFRFFGNVDIGRDVTLEQLTQHYHQICFATGAQTDKRMGIPGEDLAGSHAATEFVAWYNGHPDFRDYDFDRSAEHVAVIGVGNVAVDVARILCRTIEELETTDIADYALDALRESKVKKVYMLGRRGPAQAAFTNPEVRELGEMPGADIDVRQDEAKLDPLSQAAVDEADDRTLFKKIEIIQSLAAQTPAGKPRKLILRFLVSPVELTGDDAGRVTSMRLVKNELQSRNGRLGARATDEFEDIPVDLLFRSVGYRGVPIAGLPFREDWGTVPHDEGRVTDKPGGEHIIGMYVAGWIKRGPTGVIGTNKPDASETVAAMVADAAQGKLLTPADLSPEGADGLIRAHQPDLVSYEDWLRLNELETGKGRAQGRPRVKFTDVMEMLAALRSD